MNAVALKAENLAKVWGIVFALFGVASICVYIALVSLSLFFHLQLDHSTVVINTWLFENGWGLAMASKIAGFFVTTRYLSVHLGERHPIRTHLKETFKFPGMPVFVVSIAFLLWALFLGGPKISESPQSTILEILFSYFGMIFYFLFDALIFDLVRRIWPLSRRDSVIASGLILCAVTLSSYVLFAFGQMGTTVVAWNTAWVLLFTFLFGWSGSIPYLVIYAAPSAALIGLDPAWGAEFSPYKLSKTIMTSDWLALSLVAVGYLVFKFRRKGEWDER
jgi:hypothetical protein